MTIFYANGDVRVVLDQHGEVHVLLTSTSPVAPSDSGVAVLPRRLAEELLARLTEALMPVAPEVPGEDKPAEPELPLSSGDWVDEKPIEVERPWRERFGVES